MACDCLPNTTEACTTVYPTANPCDCDSPAGIEEIGPTGPTGPKGFTPSFSVGTVLAGNASVVVRSTGYSTRVIDFVLPAIPEGVPYTWTEVNTFTQRSNFGAGLQTTGGTSTFGGISFNVTPDATFSADVDIEGNSTISGDLDITTNLNETGQITVQGTSTFEDVEFFGQTRIGDSIWDLTNVTTYPMGTMVLGSCLNAQKQPNVGADIFIQDHGTNLVPINPVDVGPICDTIVVNVPVSACVPQVTPLLDIKVRVGYRFGPAPFTAGNFTCTLWQGGIGTTTLDFYTQGDGSINAAAGFFELRAQATLVAGNNDFDVEVTNNDTGEIFTPSDVDYTMEN